MYLAPMGSGGAQGCTQCQPLPGSSVAPGPRLPIKPHTLTNTNILELDTWPDTPPSWSAQR